MMDDFRSSCNPEAYPVLHDHVYTCLKSTIYISYVLQMILSIITPPSLCTSSAFSLATPPPPPPKFCVCTSKPNIFCRLAEKLPNNYDILTSGPTMGKSTFDPASNKTRLDVTGFPPNLFRFKDFSDNFKPGIERGKCSIWSNCHIY